MLSPAAVRAQPQGRDRSRPDLNILLEMRPALSGHAGIPQETRLLFRWLCSLQGMRVEGLLQNHSHVIGRGLPNDGREWFRLLSTDQRLNRLGRAVITLEERPFSAHLQAAAHTAAMALWHLVGGTQQLTRFDAWQFRDFIWRRLFARTLPAADFELMTQASYRIARVPWNAMHLCALATRRLGYALYPRLDTSDFDLMISETPYPATVSRRTRLVVRYHDAIPLLMPHTISDMKYHQASHYRALRRNIRSGAWFVCVSDATRRDLLSVFPEAESRSLTIHNMVSHDYFTEEASDPARIREIVRARAATNGKLPNPPPFSPEDSSDTPLSYLLIVSTIEPRKNHLTLLAAWEKLRQETYPSLKLVVVGAPGWHHKPILRRLQPWAQRGEVYLLRDVPSAELRLLYRHARATVCPSFGEGFGFSGVEAMMSGGPVVASDLAVHREVYADAAEYFNPYSVQEMSNAIRSVIDPERSARRQELVQRGASIARRYTPAALLPKWQSFLSSNLAVAA
jgi:glycosyltransferase involved in cell wall biosynthesis